MKTFSLIYVHDNTGDHGLLETFLSDGEDGGRSFPLCFLDQYSASLLGCFSEQSSVGSDGWEQAQQWVHLFLISSNDSKKTWRIMNPSCSLWHQRLLSWLGVMSKLEILTWEEIHPAAVQSTLRRRGVILASSISIKCSFPIERKEGKNGEKGVMSACWNITLPTDKQNAKCALCVFLSPLKKKAKPQLPMFSKWPTQTYKSWSAFFIPWKSFL